MSIRPVKKIDDNVKVKNALISVFDKSGLDDFVIQLLGINPHLRIYSTGGTFKKIQKRIGNYNLTEVSDYTGMPETEGGLVKTLHHKLHLGILTETYCQEHQNDLQRENAVPIDLVVCNLYPFSEVISKEDVTFEMARGNIDIGGPTMIRGAAKNFNRVGVIVDPNDYNSVLGELKTNNGNLTLNKRILLMKKAFQHTAEYEARIGSYMEDMDIDDVRPCYEIVGEGK